MSYSTASPTAQPSFGKMSEPPTTLKLLVIGEPASPSHEGSNRDCAVSAAQHRSAGSLRRARCGVPDRITRRGTVGWGDTPPPRQRCHGHRTCTSWVSGTCWRRPSARACVRQSTGHLGRSVGFSRWINKLHLHDNPALTCWLTLHPVIPVAGASSVGKSSLLLRFTDETFLSPDETSGACGGPVPFGSHSLPFGVSNLGHGTDMYW